jgi:hypothetical protein
LKAHKQLPSLRLALLANQAREARIALSTSDVHRALFNIGRSIPRRQSARGQWWSLEFMEARQLVFAASNDDLDRLPDGPAIGAQELG